MVALSSTNATKTRVLVPLRKTPLGNTVRKGEIAGNKHFFFLFFYNVFYAMKGKFNSLSNNKFDFCNYFQFGQR